LKNLKASIVLASVVLLGVAELSAEGAHSQLRARAGAGQLRVNPIVVSSALTVQCDVLRALHGMRVPKIVLVLMLLILAAVEPAVAQPPRQHQLAIQQTKCSFCLREQELVILPTTL
jgi:hypothetical protein